MQFCPAAILTKHVQTAALVLGKGVARMKNMHGAARAAERCRAKRVSQYGSSPLSATLLDHRTLPKASAHAFRTSAYQSVESLSCNAPMAASGSCNFSEALPKASVHALRTSLSLSVESLSCNAPMAASGNCNFSEA